MTVEPVRSSGWLKNFLPGESLVHTQREQRVRSNRHTLSLLEAATQCKLYNDIRYTTSQFYFFILNFLELNCNWSQMRQTAGKYVAQMEDLVPMKSVSFLLNGMEKHIINVLEILTTEVCTVYLLQKNVLPMSKNFYNYLSVIK